MLECGLVAWVAQAFVREAFPVAWPVRLLRSSTALLTTVLYIPVQGVLVAVMQCESPAEIALWKEVGMTCWRGGHATMVAAASILAVVLFCFSIACAAVIVDEYVTLSVYALIVTTGNAQPVRS